jgi:hypothetical protein
MTIEDLTPFFADRCAMHVILARQADVGVILRRGPTRWWRITLWDTRRDTFQPGQWFHGRIYPEKCDVSPNGKLFLYFAAKFANRDPSYGDSWTAVSRPPYLTALALWPVGGTYGGAGVFIDDRTVAISNLSPETHPDHPPGPLRILDWSSARNRDSGWMGELAPGARTRYKEFRKACGNLVLGLEPPASYGGLPRRSVYTLYKANLEPLAMFEAHWADWDQHGRLVATAGGRVLSGKLTRKKALVWRQLAAMHEETPAPLPPPRWAQRW